LTTVTPPTSETVPDINTASAETQYFSPEELPTVLRISEKLRRFVDAVGRFGAWFALPLILITAWDLIVRKFFSQQQIWLVENVSPIFGSTLLQELEWHSHTVLVTLVLGFGYIWNTHVRVDLVRERVGFRHRAWLEFIGLTFFLIPYTCVVVYYAAVYAFDSWAINRPVGCAWYQCGEISASLVGLSHRWIIKSVLVFGLGVAILAGISVWLQVAVVLFGPKHWRYDLMTLEWPEDIGSTVEGKERLELETLVDQVEERARLRREKEAAEQAAGG